jgi:hypothetical protein
MDHGLARGSFRWIVRLAVALALVPFAAQSAGAQHLIELRGAPDSEYRFVDWSYSFASGLVTDVFYVGVPGSNELNVGGGYAIKRGGLVLTPLVYVVVGKEGGQRGVKVALLVQADSHGWKLSGFLAGFASVSGDVGAYQVLDTLDVTRAIDKRWELGVQAGFFKVGDHWNPQVGPLVKFDDAHGAWAVSYRFGPQHEFRVGRVVAF